MRLKPKYSMYVAYFEYYDLIRLTYVIIHKFRWEVYSSDREKPNERAVVLLLAPLAYKKFKYMK